MKFRITIISVFKMYGHDSLTMEFDLTRTNHRKNVLYKISYAKEVLDQASKIYWICDSKRPREHFNYVRLTKLLQGMYVQYSCSFLQKLFLKLIISYFPMKTFIWHTLSP